MPPIELAERLALLFALALFLGLAFEEIYKLDERALPGGIRTFPLIALASTMLYLVEPHWASAFTGGLARIGHVGFRVLLARTAADHGDPCL